MRALRFLPIALVAHGLAGPAAATNPTPGECTRAERGGPSHCLYRSMFPSAGLVSDCESQVACRVGYYTGDAGRPIWFEPPRGVAALPKPDVIWHTATLAEARFGCGTACSFSYFFEARRRLLSTPRWFVLDVDPRRLLFAAAEERALVVRQLFSGREVARIERPWAPTSRLGAAITSVRFDADGRLSFTWLRGSERQPVSERVSVPSLPR